MAKQSLHWLGVTSFFGLWDKLDAYENKGRTPRLVGTRGRFRLFIFFWQNGPYFSGSKPMKPQDFSGPFQDFPGQFLESANPKVEMG
jgi:hypothetical protein